MKSKFYDNQELSKFARTIQAMGVTSQYNKVVKSQHRIDKTIRIIKNKRKISEN